MLVLGILHYVSQWLVIDDFGSPLQPSLLIGCFSSGQILDEVKGRLNFTGITHCNSNFSKREICGSPKSLIPLNLRSLISTRKQFSDKKS